MKRTVLIVLLLMLSGCRPVPVNHPADKTGEVATPAPAESAKESPADATEVATSAPADPEEAAKWRRINGVEIFRRPFIVRAGGVRVGNAVLTLREFQDGVVLRTGLEYWLFRKTEGKMDRKSEYFFRGYCSEFGDRRPVAMWGQGHWHDRSGKFRLQGEGGKLKVTGNRFLHYMNPKTYQPPEGYRLLLALRHNMEKAVSKEGPASFTWKRCLWRREDPLKWQTYTYAYTGVEKIVSAEGKEHSAHRFDITPEGASEPTESVWVDDKAWPLRRVVPGMNGFEMLVSDRDRGDDVSDLPAWNEIKKQLGEERASRTILPADIAF